MTASLSSNTKSLAFDPENDMLGGTKSTLDNISISLDTGDRSLFLWASLFREGLRSAPSIFEPDVVGESTWEGVPLPSVGFPLLRGLLVKTSVISDHSVSAGMPARRTAVSRDTTSASVDECETTPCFLHIHESGTKVLGPIRTR